MQYRFYIYRHQIVPAIILLHSAIGPERAHDQIIEMLKIYPAIFYCSIFPLSLLMYQRLGFSIEGLHTQESIEVWLDG